MLLSRSTLQICVLLLLISSVLSQYYNPDYRVSDDLENADHAGYTGGSSTAEVSEADEESRPDYSKYYNKDTASSPLIDGASSGFLSDAKETDHGFVTPLDFSGFFGSAQFGAATNQQQSLPVIPVQSPFHFQDALKKQNSSGFVDAGEFSSNFNNAPNFELDVGKHFGENPFEPKTENTYVAPKKDSYIKSQSYKSEADDLNNYKKYNSKDYEKNLDYTKPKTDYSAPLNTNYNYPSIVPTLSSYTGGKINHLSTVKTYVPQLFPTTKLTNAPLNIPYQKYNFQPTVGLPKLDLKSTLAPLNSYNLPSTANTYYGGTNDYTPTEFAQPSEYKSQKVQNSNCQKVAKHVSPEDISHGRFRRQADKMNCYLCKDPKSGGTYEQCSYTSDPEDDKSYFRGHAEKYSTKTYTDPEEHSRNRRDTKKERSNKRKRNDDKEEQVEQYENPYSYNKKNSHKFNSKPQEFDETSYYKAPDFSHYEKDSENYRFGPEYFSEAATEEKSYSELQSEELKKGDNCKKIKKDSMTCMVCSNPKTGGNYEQCSYTSEPKEKKYAYVNEKKYNSNDPEPEEKTVESTENKPTIQRNKSRFTKPTVEFSASTKHPKQSNNEKDDYYIPHDYLGETKQTQKRYEPTEREEEIETKNKHGDYMYKLFPEYAEKESKNREIKQRPSFEYKSDLPEYFTAEESKKDVDSVLQEFTKKDRSKCKKIAKDKMTCYICLDNKGVQHEECMFVSESQPKSSHIAYHEVKEFSSDPKKQNGDEETADSKQSPKIKIPEIKRKSKKVNPAKITLKEVDAEPTEYVKVVGKTPRIVRRKTNISKDIFGAQESKRDEIKVKRPQRETKEENYDKEEQKEEQFEIPEGPEGAYASELVPVYDKKLGVTLPKFMVEISEDEKVFDEVVKSG